MNKIIHYETNDGISISRCKLRKDNIIMVGSHFCGKCKNYIDHDNPVYPMLGWVLCKGE
jgi:hypothetical protein